MKGSFGDRESINLQVKFSREFERKVAVKSEFSLGKVPNSRENLKRSPQVTHKYMRAPNDFTCCKVMEKCDKTGVVY